jgi:hypothetical protein
MSTIKREGTYTFIRNENLDEYFKAIGVPYIPRKMMLATSPTIEVTKTKDEDDTAEDEGDTWVIKTVTFFRTTIVSFKLNEAYEEEIPSGDILQNVTRSEGDSFITECKNEKLGEFERIFDFTDDGLIITMKSKDKGVQAKRYFKRA